MGRYANLKSALTLTAQRDPPARGSTGDKDVLAGCGQPGGPLCSAGMSDVTRLLDAAAAGDTRAAAELLPLVYDELRKLAAVRLSAEPAGNTLQPTALVHEAYLRLVGGRPARDWDGRGHFFAAAAEAMRRLLIDQARRKAAARHGGGRARRDVAQVEIAAPVPDSDLLALDEALARFEAHDPAKAALVKLRYFAGLTIPEAAAALGIAPSTADRHWAYARAWLHAELSKGESAG
jgi:RNA polymerase sigma factor (TIGR02999 family)